MDNVYADEIARAAIKRMEAKRAFEEADREFMAIVDKIPTSENPQMSLGAIGVASIVPNGHSIKDQILNVVNSDTSKLWDYDSLMVRLPNGTATQTVRSLVYRLVKDNKLDRAERGKFKSLAS